MAKKKNTDPCSVLHASLYEGDALVPEDERFKEGETVWLIADPPTRAEVALDSGHPRWLTILTWSSEGEMRYTTFRTLVRTSERRAARAMVTSLRKQAAELERQARALSGKFGLRG